MRENRVVSLIGRARRKPTCRCCGSRPSGTPGPVCRGTGDWDPPTAASDIIEIYRRRWGIELYYRHFKQTFARRKLRSHAAESVLCEAHWSLIGLWAMLLYAEQHLHRRHVLPRRMSVAGVLRAFRGLLKQPLIHHPDQPGFHARLGRAVVDRYVRTNKRSRQYPRKKYDPPCRPPTIQIATHQQQQRAKQLKPGLTA